LSLIKMLENMGKDEIFSYHGFGYIDDLQKINRDNLYKYYKEVLKNNKVDIFVLGDIDVENTKKIIFENFKFNTIKQKKNDYIITHEKYRIRSKKVIEEENVSQSKLSIGCKLFNLTKYESNYVLPLYSTILGGGSDSKLFKEVRESNSLCYYISSSSNKLDNVLFITSGISSNNFDKTVRLIKKGIKDMENGKFNEEDINKAKVQYITMLEELLENPFQIISSYYSMEILNNDDIETRIKRIKEVTYNDIKNISKKVHVDTVYLLKGVE
ncbi:MAG: insulinase family protein, partial [bacterium]|nr:insulinase family protein [bacterium]